MRRRPDIQAAGAGFVLALASACSGGIPEADSVVLITLDTTRSDALGSYSGSEGITPNLDRLAEESIVFDAAFIKIFLVVVLELFLEVVVEVVIEIVFVKIVELFVLSLFADDDRRRSTKIPPDLFVGVGE